MRKGRAGISVIMPVHNGRRYLPTSLAAVRRSDCPDYELIVVDDRSTDGSADISRAYADIVIESDARGGPAKARNLGARQSGGEVLMFLDADVRICPDSLSKVAAEMETHPDIAAVFGSYDDAPPEKNFASSFKNLLHHYVHQNSRTEASTFWAGCGAVRRSVFFDAGGFPEAYSRASIEDVEFGYALAAKGLKIRVMKGLQVAHLKRWSLAGLVKTDIVNRAIPWTKLSVRKGLPRDLNFKISDRISGAVCLLLPPLSILPGRFLLIVPLCFVLLFLNAGLYAFFFRKKGIGFAVPAAFFHWFYLFYSSAVFLLGGIYFYLRRALRGSKNEKKG